MLGTWRTSAREKTTIAGVGQFTTSGGRMDPTLAPARKGDDEYRRPKRVKQADNPTPKRRNRRRR